MSKAEKLLQRLLTLPRDFTWEELVTVLRHLGYNELTNSGSRRKFIDAKQHMINLHKPHPSNIIKHYALKQVVEHLQEKGLV
jgi:predicted RNA binding protein YcfA (HicA-like mRNA interferase family)